MPTHKSAAKRMKTAERDRQKNRKTKSVLRGAIKEYKELKSVEEKTTSHKGLSSTLDVAARKNVIHKNKASRLKSRLAKQIKSK